MAERENDKKKIRVALIRGDSLNEWEGQLWNNLSPSVHVAGICSRKNLYPRQALQFPVIQLDTTTDHRIRHQWMKYRHGIFQKLYALEELLHGYDIAHTAEIYSYYTYQAVVAKQHNPSLKVVTTVWDNSFDRFEVMPWLGYSRPPAWWRKRIYRLIQATVVGVDLFLPVSTMSVALLKDVGVPEEKIQLLPPAIYHLEQSPKDVSEAECVLDNRHHVKLGSDRLYLMVNRMVKEKGVYDVLAAWRMYLRTTKDIKSKRLLLIGDGSERRHLMQLVHAWNLKEHVVSIPSLPNSLVRVLYGKVEALILGSIPTSTWQEQFGYVLAEAITSGCPVVATTSGAIPEVVGRAGILVPPGNPVALCDALHELDHGNKRDEIKKRCEEEKQRFEPSRFQTSLIDMYQRVLSV